MGSTSIPWEKLIPSPKSPVPLFCITWLTGESPHHLPDSLALSPTPTVCGDHTWVCVRADCPSSVFTMFPCSKEEWEAGSVPLATVEYSLKTSNIRRRNLIPLESHQQLGLSGPEPCGTPPRFSECYIPKWQAALGFLSHRYFLTVKIKMMASFMFCSILPKEEHMCLNFYWKQTEHPNSSSTLCPRAWCVWWSIGPSQRTGFFTVLYSLAFPISSFITHKNSSFLL